MLPSHVLRNEKKWKTEKDRLVLGLESLKNYKDNLGTSRQWKMKMDYFLTPQFNSLLIYSVDCLKL